MIGALISAVVFAAVSLFNPATLQAEEPFIVYEDGEEFYVEDAEAYIDEVCSGWKTNGYYPDCGAILEEPTDIVTITMQNGNRFWFWNDDGDWARGDLVAVLFYDNGTAIVHDDVIIGQPKYAGWISDREMKTWIKVGG